MTIRAFKEVAALFVLIFIHTKNVHSQSPNIIFMVIDDLGWNDVSFHGSVQIPTPNIDTLAYSGVILNNYYVQPICTPSRGALMTGKYPIRLGLQHYVISSATPWGLSPKEMILPQYLKQLGYDTHGVGKWHLGFFESDYLPTNRGFDSFLGYWTGKEDYFTHFEEDDGLCGLDFHDGTKTAWNYFGYYSTEAFTDRATTIIKNHNSSNPLFLYISHQAMHAGNSYSPLQAPEEYIAKFSHIKDEQRRNFAGMASALDKSVGEVFSALDDADILKNSIIVFTSDNGGAVEGIDESTGSNWPLRGSKYNMWEGGIKGTAFVWSPLLPHSKGSISDNLMHITDWLPTLFAAAGGDPNKLGLIDGHNVWPFYNEDSYSPRNHILYNIDPEWKVEAIRKGQYKLLRGSVFNGEFDGWFDKEGKRQENTPFEEDYLRIQNQVYERELQNSEIIQIMLKKYKKDLDFLYKNPVEGIEHCYSKSQEGINCDDSDIYKNPTRSFPHFFGPPVEVNCGPKPKNASSNCQPEKETCLFDIEKDPCEYNNLANVLPTVVQDLEELLNIYRAQAVPIRNKPADPAGNPKYHEYAWVPWIKTN